MKFNYLFSIILASYITGDNRKLIYRKGTDLIKLFNKFGCTDNATSLSTSREYYSLKQFELVKNKKKFLEHVFNKEFWHPEWENIDESLNGLNHYFIPMGWYIERRDDKILINESIIGLSFKSEFTIENDVLLDQINKMEKRFVSQDYDGVITIAFSSIETLLLLIYLDDKKEEYKYDGNIEKLHKVVRDILKTNPSVYANESIKAICSSFCTVINSLSNLRNAHGDAHGRIDRYRLDLRHAALAFNSSKIMLMFLYDSYVSKKIKSKNNE